VVLHDYALYKSTFTLLYFTWILLLAHHFHRCNAVCDTQQKVKTKIAINQQCSKLKLTDII